MEVLPPESAQYLSPREFAQRSGLSLATVYRYLAARLIPKVQPRGKRGRVLIPVAALEALASLRPSQPSEPAAIALTSRPRGPAPRWTKQGRK
jgi:hypothetical protein